MASKKRKLSAKQKHIGHHVVHHTKRLYHLTPKFVHGMVVGGFFGIIAVMTLNMVMPASALTLSSPRDCDTNAVINCGALTTKELQQRYDNKGVAAIYKYFGITATDIKNVDKTAVAGRVYKDGKVVVNGTVVATKAITAGRHDITGSTKVSSGGVTFYKRPPSVSFRADSLAAFVIIEKGEFKFAVLAACGNPVMATAVKKAQPVPEPPEPPKEEPTPVSVPRTSTQTPPSTPTPVILASTTKSTLPDTGPGEVLIIGLLSVIGGYIFHVTHRHVRRKRHLRSVNQ